MATISSLESLPTELLYQIIGYLVSPLCGRASSTGLDWPGPLARYKDECKPVLHPLNQLASTSRRLNIAVEEACRHLVLQHRHIGNFQISQNEFSASVQCDGELRSKAAKRKEIYRRIWLKWSPRHCAFCGRATVRRAIFNNNLFCCKKCDETNFPDKIVSKITVPS